MVFHSTWFLNQTHPKDTRERVELTRPMTWEATHTKNRDVPSSNTKDNASSQGRAFMKGTMSQHNRCMFWWAGIRVSPGALRGGMVRAMTAHPRRIQHPRASSLAALASRAGISSWLVTDNQTNKAETRKQVISWVNHCRKEGHAHRRRRKVTSDSAGLSATNDGHNRMSSPHRSKDHRTATQSRHPRIREQQCIWKMIKCQTIFSEKYFLFMRSITEFFRLTFSTNWKYKLDMCAYIDMLHILAIFFACCTYKRLPPGELKQISCIPSLQPNTVEEPFHSRKVVVHVGALHPWWIVKYKITYKIDSSLHLEWNHDIPFCLVSRPTTD